MKSELFSNAIVSDPEVIPKKKRANKVKCEVPIPSTNVQNGVVVEGEGGPWQVSVCDRGGETRSSQFEEGNTAESTHCGERRTT